MDAQPRKLVLVADDYEGAAAVMAELIELETSHEAVAVLDGARALELALLRCPAACLLDIDMPTLDGIEVAGAIRRALGESRPLLIAITGGPRFVEAKQGGRFDHVLLKPIDHEQLFKLLWTI
jgi:CheY-like chemotaxis protein